MQPFTSRELYIMNGGQKLYIHRDGFGDVYNATPEEEAEWAKEVIEIALQKIKTEENQTELQSAVDNLQYHRYEELGPLLLKTIAAATPDRKRSFINILTVASRHNKSLANILDLLDQH